MATSLDRIKVVDLKQGLPGPLCARNLGHKRELKVKDVARLFGIDKRIEVDALASNPTGVSCAEQSNVE